MEIMTRDQHRANFLIELDAAELAVRLIECAGEMKRPPGKSAAECLDDHPANVRQEFLRLAETAIIWFGECANKGVRPS